MKPLILADRTSSLHRQLDEDRDTNLNLVHELFTGKSLLWMARSFIDPQKYDILVEHIFDFTLTATVNRK